MFPLAAAVSVHQGDKKSWNNPNSCTADGIYVGNSRVLAEQAQWACELLHIYELLRSKNNSCASERRTELPSRVPCSVSQSRE